MTERLPGGNEQNLRRFVTQPTWDPVPVRRRIAERMVPQSGPDARRSMTCPSQGRPDAGGGRPSVLRCTGQTGQLPGRGERARGPRHRLLSAAVAVVRA
ncbi:hypothetical protein ACFW33_17865 [Streptomyces sp. NPDC058830]|uniref:hypothetical protein n=1 Tax=unclassified Streptomyces TaxID=2593676 RepID=UPI0036CCBAA7